MTRTRTPRPPIVVRPSFVSQETAFAVLGLTPRKFLDVLAPRCRVGVERIQLYEGSATRQRFRAHDLRATFVTVALASGHTETWVSDRTGHDGHSMIERYRRKARTWNLGELGSLCDLIPELAATEHPARIRPGLPLKVTGTGGGMADAADLGSLRTNI